MRRLLERRRGDDSGNAIIEFIFVAVIVLVPLVYLVAAVATAQRTNLAVTAAARDAGRAYATSDTPAEGERRLRAAVRLALDAQGLPTGGTDVRVVAADQGCDGARTRPTLRPGAEFAICVTRRVDLPGIPSLLAGKGVTSVGRYVVHIDDFRAAS
ncbi:TadE/TadG family type IV pilus assembly protein [Jatrophihabitans fulvus]